MMLVLDTNIVSELMRPHPNPGVLTWAGRQAIGTMALTAITVMEIGYGIARLPDGRRRMTLEQKFEQFLERGFARNVLPFDEGAAGLTAQIRALRERSGRPIEIEDSMIAAIARSRGAAVVTRDEKGFAGCGVPVVNPWTM